MVDGLPWPVLDDEVVWLPAGPHSVEPAPRSNGMRLLRLNADLKAARAIGATLIQFSYRSSARAAAVLDRAPGRIEIDGIEETPPRAGPKTILLPKGQHVVTIATQ